MPNLAIDAENLVKKFTTRKATGENKDNEAANDTVAKTPVPKRRRWPFGRRSAINWLNAVDGVSLQIKQGEVFGLLGPNGEGKSTTIRMLCTLLEPTSGTSRVNGFDITRQSNQVRQSLGTVLAGERSIYWKLTARENLEYFAALYHIPAEVAHRRGGG